MSAQIPETMLLSDLLKPTGYDCPEDLQGKTFEEATTGGDAKISTNTAKTIDVSAYTEPVEVEPAEGYDATRKVTVTLDNIPSGADLESNHAATIDVSTYTEPVEIEPTAGKDGMEKVTVTLDNIPSGGSATAYAWQTSDSRTPAAVSYVYISADTAPADSTEAATTQMLMGNTHEGTGHLESLIAEDETYTRVSDTEFEISWEEGGTTTTITYTRASTKDIVFWG